jgi:hypothetical protein
VHTHVCCSCSINVFVCTARCNVRMIVCVCMHVDLVYEIC